jgi:hypothetical protein
MTFTTKSLFSIWLENRSPPLLTAIAFDGTSSWGGSGFLLAFYTGSPKCIPERGTQTSTERLHGGGFRDRR